MINIYYHLAFLIQFLVGCTGLFKVEPFCRNIVAENYYTIKMFLGILFYFLYGPRIICIFNSIYFKVSKIYYTSTTTPSIHLA